MRDGANSPGEATGVLVVRAAHLAGWLARTSWQVGRRLPGGALAERELLKLETALLIAARPSEPVTLVLPSIRRDIAPLRMAMAELLNRSANTDASGAAHQLFAAIVAALVPDEARILAALADGEPRPAVDILQRGPLGTPLGNSQRVVLRNASTVGRAAGVSAPEYVPVYVTRLYRMGLVDVGDEDPELVEQYDILMTDQVVRAAEARARQTRRSAARVVRHTVTISELGRRFWQASDPTTL